jgi:hypothetical protein
VVDCLECETDYSLIGESALSAQLLGRLELLVKLLPVGLAVPRQLETLVLNVRSIRVRSLQRMGVCKR